MPAVPNSYCLCICWRGRDALQHELDELVRRVDAERGVVAALRSYGGSRVAAQSATRTLDTRRDFDMVGQALQLLQT